MSDLDLTRPFTKADAVAAGVDPKILRTSRFRRLFRCVYVRADAVDERTRIRAALALHPASAYASHHSAARLFGLPVPDCPDEHVTVPHAEYRRKRAGIACHAVITDPDDVVVVHGIRSSRPVRLFVELAGVLSLVDLVVLGDALVRVFKIDPAELVGHCEQASRHHAAAALRAARLVRRGVDSPMESRLRMLIVLAGLPEPKVNHLLLDKDGCVARRLDLSYPSIRLIVEYDGRQHAEDVDQWHGDIDRREEFDAGGWRLLVVTAAGIYRHPERTLQRIRAQLISRGWGTVPSLAPGWEVHFPGRGTLHPRN